MKRPIKWLLWLLAIPLLLVCVVVAAVVFVAGTDTGFSLAAKQAATRVPGLSLSPIEGNLLSGIQGEAIGFENDAFDVQASGVDSAWRAGCLLKRRFCLDRLVIDEVVFAPKPSDEPAPPPSEEDIALPQITLPIGVDIEEVLIKRFVFAPPGEGPDAPAPQVVENIRLAGSADGDTVTLRELSIGNVPLADARYGANAAGTVSLSGDYPIALQLALTADGVLPASVLAAGSAGGAEPAPPADDNPVVDSDAVPVTGDADDRTLDPAARDLAVGLSLTNTVAELDVTAEITGAVQASLQARVQPLKKTLPLQASLQAPSLGFPVDTQTQVKAADVQLGLDGTLADYALTLTTTVTGEQVPEATLDIAGSVNTERVVLPDLAIGTLGGSIDGTASVDWSDGLKWLTALVIAELEPGQQVEGLEGVLNGRVRTSGSLQDEALRLQVPELSVAGELNGYPFKLNAVARRGDDEIYRIEMLSLDNGANRIRGAGTIGETLDVTLNAALPELQNLLPGLTGGFNADIVLSGPLAEPGLTLDASAAAITYDDILVQGIRIDADVDRAALADSSLNVAVGAVVAGSQDVQNIRLNAAGTRGEHTLTLFADGPQRTAIDLALAGGLSEQLDWDGRLDAVTLEVPAHTIVLAEPTAMRWKNAEQQFGIDAHCWTTEQTELCLQDDVVAAADGDARLTLDTYPLARLNPFLPAESTLEGTLGLQADLAWGAAQPGGFKASVATRIDDGGFEVRDAYDDPVTFTYEQLTLDAVVDPTAIDAQLVLESSDLGTARADVQIDPAGEEKSLAGTISLDGLEFAVAKAFLPDFDEIDGTLNADGTLGGTLGDPRFDGEIIVDSPVVRGEALPLEVTGGRLVAAVRGKRATLSGGIDAGGGRIDVEGGANWARERWRAEVELIGDDLDIRSDPLQESNIDHRISIVARPGDIRVDGRIEIPMALIDVAELPQGAATLSDDIVVIEDIEEEVPEDIDQVGGVDPPGDTRLRVDLEIALGDDVEVDAYGLTANLTGDMEVALRSPNPPQLSGEIEVVDGLFKKYGQNLEATGRVVFVGPVSATRLDIEAIRRIDNEDRIAGLRIEGDIEEPDINLFTDPEDKSDESILSYIILGRDIGAASDQDASLLAAAALALTVKGGKVVGQGVADSLGIQEFGFETQGRGDDTELVVSGRINDRLLLKYGRSVFEPGNTLYLRYDLAKNLYLEAADGVGTAVDLFYEFAF